MELLSELSLREPSLKKDSLQRGRGGQKKLRDITGSIKWRYIYLEVLMKRLSGISN